MPNLCVFCGSRAGQRSTYASHAEQVGQAIAASGAGLVYGGGSVGLMGKVAEAAYANGAPVYGVIPGGLFEREQGRDRCTDLWVVNSMHERKAKMAELADAFLALPGGAGTLDELFEIFTWRQIGIHSKPVGLLNSEGFYDHLIEHIDAATRDGFIAEADRALWLIHTEPAAAVRDLLSAIPSG